MRKKNFATIEKIMLFIVITFENFIDKKKFETRFEIVRTIF